MSDAEGFARDGAGAGNTRRHRRHWFFARGVDA